MNKGRGDDSLMKKRGLGESILSKEIVKMGDVDYIHSLMGGTRLLLGEYVNMKLVEYDEGC